MSKIALHQSPRKYQATLDRNTILLIFASGQGAEAFDHWFEFQGGNELFADWVLQMQERAGKYLDVKLGDN